MKSNVRRQSVTKEKINHWIHCNFKSLSQLYIVPKEFQRFIHKHRATACIIHETTCSRVTSSHLLFHSTIMFVFILHAKYFSLTDKTQDRIMSWEHPRQCLTPHRGQLHHHDILWQLPNNNLNTIPVHRRFISSEFLNFSLSEI